MSMRRAGVVAVVCLGLGAAGCTGSAKSPGDGVVTVSTGSGEAVCDNGLFAHHVGLAGGAMRGLVWKPFSAGAFADRAAGRQEAIATGSRAAVMAAQQLTKAGSLLRDCPAFAVLLQPVTDAVTRSALVGEQLSTGTVDAAALGAADSALTAVESQATSIGLPIVEREPTRAELAALPTTS